MTRLRCQWCGMFVQSDTKPSVRRTKGGDGVWRTFTQTLCPTCSRSALHPSPWNQPISGPDHD